MTRHRVQSLNLKHIEFYPLNCSVLTKQKQQVSDVLLFLFLTGTSSYLPTYLLAPYFDAITLLIDFDKISTEVSQWKAQIVSLASKSGRPYLGVKTNPECITPYLDELRLNTSAAEYHQLIGNQQERDSGHYHLTVISPPELELLDTEDTQSLIGLEVILQPLGVGKVSKLQNSAYFVVVECSVIDQLRDDLALPEKDLHITLGFNVSDIHDRSKGSSSLI